MTGVFPPVTPVTVITAAAVLALPLLLYELVDELRDDDLRYSVIDSPWLLFGLLVADLEVLAVMLL